MAKRAPKVTAPDCASSRAVAVAFSPELGDTICERLAFGESLRTICAEQGMPAVGSVMRWLASDDEQHAQFREQYMRAREGQAEALVDRALDVARLAPETQYGIERARLEIDTIKWYAGKVRPKVYGDAEKGPGVVVNNMQDNRSLYAALPPPQS